MLEKEYNYFLNNLKELFELYPNKYIVIKDEEVKFASSSKDKAFSYACNHFEIGQFLIQPCIISPDVSQENIEIEGNSSIETNPSILSLSVKNKGYKGRIVSPISLIDTFTKKELKTMALWDTGAESCYIDKNIAQQLGLKAIGVRFSRGLHGKEETVNVYDLKIALNNQPVLLSTPALECGEYIDRNIGFIIGMSIISMGEFSHNHKGIMSFKMLI